MTKTSSDSTELYYAEMESARNAAEDAYFTARPQLMRTAAEKSIFRAGFERAFQQLWNARSQSEPSAKLPDCTCGHSHFWHTNPERECCMNDCECERYSPRPAPAPNEQRFREALLRIRTGCGESMDMHGALDYEDIHRIADEALTSNAAEPRAKPAQPLKIRVIEPFRSVDGVRAHVFVHSLGGDPVVIIDDETPGLDDGEVVLNATEAENLRLWLGCALNREPPAQEPRAQPLCSKRISSDEYCELTKGHSGLCGLAPFAQERTAKLDPKDAVSSIDFHQRSGRRELCNRCDGSGVHVFPFSNVTCECSHCKGTGWAPVEHSPPLAGAKP